MSEVQIPPTTKNGFIWRRSSNLPKKRQGGACMNLDNEPLINRRKPVPADRQLRMFTQEHKTGQCFPNSAKNGSEHLDPRQNVRQG